MALRVLVTDGMDAGAMEQLRKDGYEVIEQFYEPDQLGAALRDFDVVIIRSATKIKEPQIDAAAGSRLKLIIRAGVGVDNIAVKYAEEHGIQVKNTPRASSNAVAELALALLFSCARNISIAGHTMRENKWEKKAYSKGFELSGKTMGVIGYGRIGQLVGAKGQALGMNVLSVVHRNKPEGCECETMHFVTMDELLSQSDIVVLCAPSGDKPLVDAESLAKMKDGVVILNFARDTLVNDDDMAAALEAGKVARYVSDFPNPKVVHMKNVILTPHLGASTRESEDNCAVMAVKEITDYLENGNIKNSVNYPACDMGVCQAESRIAVLHMNIPNMIGQITAILAAQGVNISDMTNKSRDKFAYTLLDLEHKPEEATVEKLKAIEGVLRVRIVK